ncbi:MAG: phenylalanine--tRNA ligase subunit beta [Opitutales bacterium]
MKISYQWLKQYVDLDRSLGEVESALSLIGFEVDEVETIGLPNLPQVVVGEVLAKESHPNADRLSVCKVSTGPEEEPHTIVCGATNYKVGDRVPVALPGAVLPGGFEIKSSKLRGVLSHGMLCSANEIGLGKDSEGLFILEERPELGAPINEVFPENDTVFSVEVTPNRPDCLSHIGMARELAAYFGADLRYPGISHSHSFSSRENGGDSLLPNRVDVQSPEHCPFYTAYRLSGVAVAPSPFWLKRRLEAIGLRPINNVVDITNFVLHEVGQPLHAFDANKIQGGGLVVRQAEKGETLVTLDGKQRSLDERMMVIADLGRPLVVAGVMGSIDAEVDDSTTDIVLESAFFEPASIRWTSKKLNLSSDSSYRFERGVDPCGIQYAAERAIDLILDIAGGHIAGAPVQVGAEPVVEREISIDCAYIEEKCGFPIEEKTVHSIFESLGFNAFRHDEDDEGTAHWSVEIPSFRSDLEEPIDLVEEVVRIHGTDKIPAAPVLSVGVVQEDSPLTRFMRRSTAYLAGQHFNECMSYTLRSEAELGQWLPSGAGEALRVLNPLSADQSHLRSSLLPGLLDALKLNQHRKTGARRFFECGRVFREKDGEVFELHAVAFVLFNPEKKREWLRREPEDFYKVKNHIESLSRQVAIDLSREPFQNVAQKHPAWQDGHSFSQGDVARGFEAQMGLLNLRLVKDYDLEGEVFAGTLEVLPSFLDQPRVIPAFRPFSLYPAAERDLALLVPAGVMAGEVGRRLEEIARRVAGDTFLVESVDVFDVYTGKGIPEGKKSLAFSFTFRARDRTLGEGEVHTAFEKIQEQVTKETDYQIRGT